MSSEIQRIPYNASSFNGEIFSSGQFSSEEEVGKKEKNPLIHYSSSNSEILDTPEFNADGEPATPIQRHGLPLIPKENQLYDQIIKERNKSIRNRKTERIGRKTITIHTCLTPEGQKRYYFRNPKRIIDFVSDKCALIISDNGDVNTAIRHFIQRDKTQALWSRFLGYFDFSYLDAPINLGY